MAHGPLVSYFSTKAYAMVLTRPLLMSTKKKKKKKYIHLNLTFLFSSLFADSEDRLLSFWGIVPDKAFFFIPQPIGFGDIAISMHPSICLSIDASLCTP